MAEMLFEDVNGQPFPRMGIADGGIAERDGKAVLNLSESVVRFIKSETELRGLWEDTFPWMVEKSTDAPVHDYVPPYVAAPGANDRDFAMSRLRQNKYKHLSDEQFSEFAARARILGLDPLRDQVFAETRHNAASRRPEIVMIVGAMGFRSIAHRTGQYMGNEPVKFTVGERRVGPRNLPVPDDATAVVYRRINNTDVPFAATVHWDDYYPGPGTLYDEKPRPCLGKCAVVAAIREAFPDETAKCYAPEELLGPRPAGSGPSGNGLNAEPPAPVADDDAPQTKQQLELRMINDLGVKEPSRRAEIITQFRKQYGYVEDGAIFWANVFRALRSEPKKYGVDRVA